MFRPLLLIWLLTACSLTAWSQESQKKVDWLPPGNLFPALRFDPLEAQTSGALYANWADNDWLEQSFANFSAGFRRNIIRFRHKEPMRSEIGLELGVFTQFLFEDAFAAMLVTFFNVEFKVGAAYQYRLTENWSFRARLYHLSSHLGDDYLIRSSIDSFQVNRRIYEMLDLSAAWRKGPWMDSGHASIPGPAWCWGNPATIRLP